MIEVTDELVRQWTEYLTVAMKPGSKASMEMVRECHPLPSSHYEDTDAYQIGRVLTITIKIEQPEN